MSALGGAGWTWIDDSSKRCLRAQRNTFSQKASNSQRREGVEFPEQSVSNAIKEWQKFLDMLGTPVPCQSKLKTISCSFHGRLALTTEIMQASRWWAMCALRLLHAEDGIEKARNSSRVINQIIKKVNSKAIIHEPAPGDVVPSGNLDSSEVKCVVTTVTTVVY